MPDSAEHRADMAVLAMERRRAGRPVWEEKVLLGDVFRGGELPFEARRDAIVARLKASRWYRNADPDDSDGVREIVDYHLAEAEDVDEFDGWWDELYDHADRDRVWIDVHTK